MAEQTASKVPQIRFKGFDGEWEEKITGDLCGEFHSGKFISASEIAEIGKYPVYGGNGLRGFSAKYNHDGLYALIGRQGALCGNMNLFSGKAFFTEHAVAVQANMNNDTFFLYYLLGRMNLGQYSSQSAQPGLAVNKLQKLSSWVCTKTEQTQIGGYFRELDRLIGLHQRKHDKLVTLKKAMLQKMFPQPGATTPEIRFKGFSGKWNMEPVASLLTERNVQAPKSDKYPLMAFISGQGVAPKGERYNREFLVSDEANKKYKQTEFGDFIYSSNNLETGSIGINKFGCASISPVYSIFSPKQNADSDFMGQLLCQKSFICEMVKWRQGVVYGQWRIHESDFLRIETTFPFVDEQKKIGTYFRLLDELISKHAIQLKKLQQIKSACLEKMFI